MTSKWIKLMAKAAANEGKPPKGFKGIEELATEMGISPGYLAHKLPTLERSGLAEKWCGLVWNGKRMVNRSLYKLAG